MLDLVKKEDYRFLYTLLSQRRSSVNISHKKMPTYAEHIRFVKSKPYSKWYILSYQRKKIGAIYLSKQNEDRKSTRLNSSHVKRSRMPSSA